MTGHQEDLPNVLTSGNCVTQHLPVGAAMLLGVLAPSAEGDWFKGEVCLT